jgi:hypothetical protein
VGPESGMNRRSLELLVLVRRRQGVYELIMEFASNYMVIILD